MLDPNNTQQSLTDEAQEPYQIKDTDQFTLGLAIALAQNGDTVRNVSTGTVLTIDDCKHDQALFC